MYEAPVESDIQSKSAADKNSAEARSSIRRSRLPTTAEQRQQRRRRLAVTAAIDNGNAAAAGYSYSRRRSPPAERSSGSNSDSNGNSNNAPSNTESSRDATREGASLISGMLAEGTSRISGMLDDHIIALIGRRQAHLHPMTQYDQYPALTDDEDPEPNPFLAHMTTESPFAHMAVEPGFLSRRVLPVPPPPAELFRTSSQTNRGPPTPVCA